MYALCVHVKSGRNYIQVSGTLAISKKRSFDTICSSHQSKLGCGNACAAIVVGVEANCRTVAAREIAAKPLDLVGVHIGRKQLNRSGQIQDYLILCSRLPDIGYRFTAFERKLQFRIAETFRRIFETNIGIGKSGDQPFDKGGSFDGDLLNLFFFLSEDNASLKWVCRIVDVDDCVFYAFNRFECTAD